MKFNTFLKHTDFLKNSSTNTLQLFSMPSTLFLCNYHSLHSLEKELFAYMVASVQQ